MLFTDRAEINGNLIDIAGRLCRIAIFLDILRGVVNLRNACEVEIEVAGIDLALVDRARAFLAVGNRVVAARERTLYARILHEVRVVAGVALMSAVLVHIVTLERRARSRIERRVVRRKESLRICLVRIAVERLERIAPSRCGSRELHVGRAVVVLDRWLELHVDLTRIDCPLTRQGRDGRSARRRDKVVVVFITGRNLQCIRHGLARAGIRVAVGAFRDIGAVAEDEIRHIDDRAAAAGLPVLIEHIRGTVVRLRDIRLRDGRQDLLRIDITGRFLARDGVAAVHIARERVVAAADAAEVIIARAAARQLDLVGDVNLLLAGEERTAAAGIGMYVRVLLARHRVRIRRSQEVHNMSVFQRDVQRGQSCRLRNGSRSIEGLRHIAEVHIEVRARRLVLRDLALAVRHGIGDFIVAVVKCRREGIVDRIIRLSGQEGAVRTRIGIFRRRRLRIIRVVLADDGVVCPEGEFHHIAAEDTVRHRFIARSLELLGVDVRCLIVRARHIARRGNRQLLRRDLARARHRDRTARLRRAAARRRIGEDIVRRGMVARKADLILDVLAVIFHSACQSIASAVNRVILLRMSALRLVDSSCRGDLRTVIRCAVLLDKLVRIRRRRKVAEVRAKLLISSEDIDILVILLVDARLFQ